MKYIHNKRKEVNDDHFLNRTKCIFEKLSKI